MWARPEAGGLRVAGWGVLLLAAVGAATGAAVVTLAGPSEDREGEPGGSAVTFSPATATVRLEPLDPTNSTLVPEILEATSAIPLANGWLLLDDEAGRVHVLSAKGALLRSFARKGEGPGELRRPAGLALLGSGIAVVDMSARRLDLFDGDGRFLRRIDVGQRDCGVSAFHDVMPWNEGLAIAKVCLQRDGRSVLRVVHVAGPEGPVSTLSEIPLRDLSTGRVSPVSFPLAAAWNGSLYLAAGPDRCLTRITAAPATSNPAPTPDGSIGPSSPHDRLCYPDVAPLPMPDSLRRAMRAEFEDIGGKLDVEIEIPDRLPLFASVRSTSGDLAFDVVAPDDRSVLDVAAGGTGLQRFHIPRRHRAFPGPETLLLTRAALDGTLVRVVSR